ncbi:MAG: c-type cytochrome biogenesis protein CcmI [Pseudorhodoplanes sp.]|nr:c-type cytochrome biogenesis protein CcmI [Pseudorhodoplanes sp.]
MTLWFVLALMTAAAIFAVLMPLAYARARQDSRGEIAVYRDQIDEIERDRAAGLIPDSEADAARLEVSRRLLAAADVAEMETPSGTPIWRRRTVALVALLLLPLAAGAIYLKLGSPNLPGASASLRETPQPEQRPIEDLVAQVERHLALNPQDGRGWDVVAPVYMRLGRFDDAVKARANAVRLLGSTAAREADLGEAQVAAANGIVTAEAKAAFDRALALDSSDVKSQYYLGLAAEQDGKPDEALARWQGLLARAPADAAYRPLIEQSIARLDPAASRPGPSADDLAAAENLSPEQRADMVRGMVERLAARLKAEGSDIDGWLRLVRAYMVLGDRDKARQAALDARQAIGADEAKQRRLDEFVRGLGLEG